MHQVIFRYADVPSINLPKKRVVQQFISDLFKLEKHELDNITYIFCSDDFLLQINKDFLQHDYYTDIITFDLSSNKKDGIIGEIYVSVDRVIDNAGLHQVPFSNEMLRVLFHGALHLCGYGDKKKREITIMRDKEDAYLRLFDKAI